MRQEFFVHSSMEDVSTMKYVSTVGDVSTVEDVSNTVGDVSTVGGVSTVGDVSSVEDVSTVEEGCKYFHSDITEVKPLEKFYLSQDLKLQPPAPSSTYMTHVGRWQQGNNSR